MPVGGNVEIIEFNEPRDMAWTTLTGVDHRLRIRLRDRAEGGTWLTVRFAYDSPGLLGASPTSCRSRRCGARSTACSGRWSNASRPTAPGRTS